MSKIVQALDEFDTACDSLSKSKTFISAKTELEGELFSIFREILQSESSKSTMGLRFTKILDKNFRFDSSGRPCHWENIPMIDEAYDKAIFEVNIFYEYYFLIF